MNASCMHLRCYCGYLSHATHMKELCICIYIYTYIYVYIYMYVRICTYLHISLQHTATQHTATHCNTLVATHMRTKRARNHSIQGQWKFLQHVRNSLQLAATPCHTLQHTATHCNTLATHLSTKSARNHSIHCPSKILQHTRNSLQHTATHCNTLATLQHT